MLLILNTNINTKNFHITEMILADAIRVLGDEQVLFVDYTTVIAAAESHPGCDILCVDGQAIVRPILARAREFARSMVLWTFDDPYNFRYHSLVADDFDFIFSNDPVAAEEYGDSGMYLPLATGTSVVEDTLANFDPSRSDFEHDLFFCGTSWPNRIVTLNNLLRDFPTLKNKFVLAYNKFTPAIPLNMPMSDYCSRISFGDFVGYARSSMMTLDLGRVFSGADKFENSTGPGPRVFEVASAGSLQISENTFKLPLMKGFAGAFQSVGTYEQLATAIENVKRDPVRAYKGMFESLQDIKRGHTYVQRIRTILSVLNDQKSSGALSNGAGFADVASDVLEESIREKPALLLVTHSLLKSDNFGGLEVHQDIIKSHLMRDYDVYFLTSEFDNEVRFGRLYDAKYEVLEHSSPVSEFINAHLESTEMEQFFSTVLQKYRISACHFFHFLNTVPSLAKIARAFNIPYTLSVHDYYMGCRQFNLLDPSGVFCGNSFDRMDQCDSCLKTHYHVGVGNQFYRRDYFSSIIDGAKHIIFVSTSARDVLKEIYPFIEQVPFSIIGAPMPNNSGKLWDIKRLSGDRNLERDPKKVCIVGNFHDNKGAKLLVSALAAAPNTDLEFHFHGGCGKALKDALLDTGANLFFHGRYDPGQLDLSAYGSALHLSPWPETYCQTLSESWEAGVVPIVTDIGALGERVEHGVNGLKIKVDGVSELSLIFMNLAVGAIDLDAIRANFSNKLYLSQEKHRTLYDKLFSELYSDLKSQNPVPEHVVSAVDLDRIGLRQRARVWTNLSDKQTHHNDLMVPEIKTVVGDDKIHKFSGAIEQTGGHTDGILYNEEFLIKGAGDELSVKNGSLFQVHGWCVRPKGKSLKLKPAVWCKLDTNEEYTFDGVLTEREDLVGSLGYEEARYFGVHANIYTLTPLHFLSGELELRTGWITATGDTFYASTDSVKVRSKFGG